MAEAYAALLVADDDERSKTETTAALDDLGDAVDVTSLSTNSLSRSSRFCGHRGYAFLCAIVLFLFLFRNRQITQSSMLAGQGYRSSVAPGRKSKGPPSRFGESLDAAVIDEGATVEHDFA
jgi:hypothetical protein